MHTRKYSLKNVLEINQVHWLRKWRYLLYNLPSSLSSQTGAQHVQKPYTEKEVAIKARMLPAMWSIKWFTEQGEGNLDFSPPYPVLCVQSPKDLCFPWITVADFSSWPEWEGVIMDCCLILFLFVHVGGLLSWGRDVGMKIQGSSFQHLNFSSRWYSSM